VSLNPDQEKKSTIRSLLIIVIIALLFVCWGMLILLLVGDKGSPAWDFGVVEDVPGQSIYSTERN
jgi:hypothetical protein